MRKLLIAIALLIPASAQAVEQDKIIHAVGSAIVCEALQQAGCSKPVAAGLTLGLGLLKEFVIDDRADAGDIVADVVGVGVGITIEF